MRLRERKINIKKKILTKDDQILQSKNIKRNDRHEKMWGSF